MVLYTEKIIENIITYKDYKPSADLIKDIAQVNDKVKMPNVVGMDVNSAINTLEDLGLQVEIQNEGEIIRSQFPAPDTELSKKSIVMIDFN